MALPSYIVAAFLAGAAPKLIVTISTQKSFNMILAVSIWGTNFSDEDITKMHEFLKKNLHS